MKASCGKTRRQAFRCILLALLLLPVLAFSLYYARQVRQQRLDHALIEAIKKQNTAIAIALLKEGAEAYERRRKGRRP